MSLNGEYRDEARRQTPEAPERLSGAEVDLLEQFRRLLWLTHRWQMLNHRRHGPTGDPLRGQGRVLRLLGMKPEISQKDLTYLLDMRPQSLGELLAKLERGGYIERTPSEADRRVMDIRLTEKGRQAAAETEPGGGLDDLFTCLTDKERAEFAGYLARVIASLEVQLGGEEASHGWNGRGRAQFGGFGGRFGMGPDCDADDPRFNGRGGCGPEDRRVHGHFFPLGGRERGHGFCPHEQRPGREETEGGPVGDV